MSKQPAKPQSQPADESDVEFVPADDRIVAKAFWISLLVVGAFAAPAALVGFFILRPKPLPPPVIVPVSPPKSRPSDDATPPPAIPFKDITAEAGIDFVRENGATGDKLLPETMGGGAAFFDYDNDGDQDLLLVNAVKWTPAPGDPPTTAALYRNNGRGHFDNVTQGSGFDVPIVGMGVAVGDVDGDGRVDVLITALGPNHLFRNRGDGTFEDATQAAGVGGGATDWNTSAAFFDADRDGDLDLFVCRYVKWSREIDFQVNYTLTGIGRAYGPPNNFEGTFPAFYVNQGDGTFVDQSEAAGVQVKDAALGRPVAKALGVVPVDLDSDGYLDLVVANDTTRKFVFHNQKNGTFKEIGQTTGLAFDREGAATGAMGIDAAHDRNDAELAVVVGNFANQMSSLYLTQGKPLQFSDAAITEGIGPATRLVLTFGAFFFDADLDGRLDILHTNGHIEDEINRVQASQHYAQPGQLFWNAGREARATYVEVPQGATGDLARPIVGRGAAYADIDGDGDLDVILTQARGRAMLLRNDQVGNLHWLRVKLKGRTPNTGGIGAIVRVTTSLCESGHSQSRLVSPSRSYLSQMELPVTFGLCSSEQVDKLEVIWPDGTIQEVGVDGVDRMIEVEQLSGS